MTKIVVFSDSHGYVGNMLEAVDREKPNYCIHLGDGEKDLEILETLYPNLPIMNVRGNCDGWSSTPSEAVFTVGGKRIFCVHGNEHRVKRYELSPELEAEARKAEADIVMFGHTHKSLYDGVAGMEVINPGTIKNDPAASYAIITVDNGKTDVKIREVN